MSDLDPVSDLERAARAVDQMQDRKAREWFKQCMAELLAGKDPRPRLGIPKVDNKRLRQARRDYWLRQAYALIQAEAPRPRCEALQAQANRFESAVWPRWRELDEPPEGASRLHACLFRACKEGAIPAWRQIFRVCVMKTDSDDTNVMGLWVLDENSPDKHRQTTEGE